MDRTEINKRNNAITARLGGPKFISENFFPDWMDVEKELIDIEDLRFHDSWDWLIPAWSKIRMDLSPTAVITAVSAIDVADKEVLYEILSNTCLAWCKQNNINL